MIYGGIAETDEEADKKNFVEDGGRNVMISPQSWHFDVTSGSIKNGPEMGQQPGFYINGGHYLTHQNHIYTLGFKLNHATSYVGSQNYKEKQKYDYFQPLHVGVIIHAYDTEANEWKERGNGQFFSSEWDEMEEH